MYHSYFGMKQRPFGTTPQIGSCFLSSSQQEALATLQYAITQGRGIGLLSGAAGSGKTLVCQHLTESLEPAFTMAMITNTNLPSIKALYQAILYDLSLPYHGLDEQELRLTLTDFLLGKYAGGGRMVLIVDEAQNLSIPLFEELRMLGNLEGGSDKLFQIILAGHARLPQVLRAPELATLDQRIGARAALAPFGDEETVAYIRHQLECAGVHPDQVFTYEAMTAVYEATAGNPRRINQLCDHALLLAYVAESRRVDAAAVEQACGEIQQLADGATTAEPDSPTESAAAAVLWDQAATVRTEQPDEEGICQSYGSEDEPAGCLEIVTEASRGAAQPEPDRPLRRATASREEVFAEEEIVVDRYAMMDAARSNAARLQSGTMPRRAVRAATPARVAETPAPDRARGEAVRSVAAPEDSTESIGFVQPSDNPASHEVGVGVPQRGTPVGEPAPVLVIESRSQRMAGNRLRVDVPQAVAPRAYRRLFSRARKN